MSTVAVSTSRPSSRLTILVLAGVAVPALTWSFLNLVLTFALGHPSNDTRELPYAEVAIQFIFSSAVFLFLPRHSRVWWIVALLPWALWTFVRAGVEGVSLVWALASCALLLSPLISWLMACEVPPTATKPLRIAFLTILVGQLLAFPLNFSGWLRDDTATDLDRFAGDLDRFTGTLLGRGGYLSTYLLLLGAALFLTTGAPRKQKAVAFICVFAYGWIAEVKLIFFVAGIVLGTMLMFSSTRRNFHWKILAAVFIVFVGSLLSLALPSAYEMTDGRQRLTPANSSQISESLARLTQSEPNSGGSALDAHPSYGPGVSEEPKELEPTSGPIEGSKMAVLIAVLKPDSALWSQASQNVALGVGASGGLSHLARVADASEIFPHLKRPDQYFRTEARSLAGAEQRDQSLVTQPESTLAGLVTETGYVGLALFALGFSATIWRMLLVFKREVVAVAVGFTMAFLPLFGLWEISGLWMVLALGMAAIGPRATTSLVTRNTTMHHQGG